MKSRIIGATAAAFAVLAFAGLASAQTVNQTNTVNVSTTAPASTPAAGSTSTFATMTLSGTNNGTYTISSLPITLTAGNGAAASYLSSCQLLNSNNTALNTGANIPIMVNGTNAFVFDTPLTISPNTTTTLSLRCALSSSSPANATYQFTAGTPVITSTTGTTASSTTTSGNLGVMLSPIASVRAGTQSAVLALLTLDASNSNQPVSVSSIPLSLTTTSSTGVTGSNYLSNCALHTATSLSTSLNTGTNAVSTPANGSNSFMLDAPVSVPAGSADILALTCNVSSAVPVGSTITVSVTPATISTSGTSGMLTPIAETTSTGTVEPTSGTIMITAPTTSTTGTTGGGTTVTGSTGTTGTPGTPNTGAGGDAPINFAILAISALVVGGSVLFVAKRRAR